MLCCSESAASISCFVAECSFPHSHYIWEPHSPLPGPARLGKCSHNLKMVLVMHGCVNQSASSTPGHSHCCACICRHTTFPSTVAAATSPSGTGSLDVYGLNRSSFCQAVPAVCSHSCLLLCMFSSSQRGMHPYTRWEFLPPACLYAVFPHDVFPSLQLLVTVAASIVMNSRCLLVQSVPAVCSHRGRMFPTWRAITAWRAGSCCTFDIMPRTGRLGWTSGCG